MGQFNVVRDSKTWVKPKSQWLSGGVDKADAEEEAIALLTDPRDNIVGVYYWSDRYQQFDGKWTRASVAKQAKKEGRV